MKLFNSKYPIICAPMNQVSDSKLAIAAHDAGIVPSLTVPFIPSSDEIQMKINLNQALFEFEQNLMEFRKHTSNGEIIAAFSPKIFSNRNLIEFVLKYKISHIEFFERLEQKDIPILQILRKLNIKIIQKYLTIGATSIEDRNKSYVDAVPHIDAISLKGPDGAARVIDTNETLMRRYEILRKKLPTKPIIISGGISTSAEIKQDLDVGAAAVSLGTVFALSQESCISHDKKLSLINMSYGDVNKVKAGSMYQNAIVFTPTPDTDENNSVGLVVGRDSADKGLIFVGKGIDNIHSIKPVAQIVKELIRDVQV
jgi:NAD(P)H-dependent flavin oxidoreductase YrpB (nitropropane dioxygenase family)